MFFMYFNRKSNSQFFHEPIPVKLFNFYTILKSFPESFNKYWETQSKKIKNHLKSMKSEVSIFENQCLE